MALIRVSSRGQIVIPEKVRGRLHIKAGTKLVLIEREGSIILKSATEVERDLAEDDLKESAGWLTIAEHALQEMWDNPKDESVWKKYIRPTGHNLAP